MIHQFPATCGNGAKGNGGDASNGCPFSGTVFDFDVGLFRCHRSSHFAVEIEKPRLGPSPIRRWLQENDKNGFLRQQ